MNVCVCVRVWKGFSVLKKCVKRIVCVSVCKRGESGGLVCCPWKNHFQIIRQVLYQCISFSIHQQGDIYLCVSIIITCPHKSSYSVALLWKPFHTCSCCQSLPFSCYSEMTKQAMDTSTTKKQRAKGNGQLGRRVESWSQWYFPRGLLWAQVESRTRNMIQLAF